MLEKDPDAGKDQRQTENDMAEDEVRALLTMDMNLSKLRDIVKDREPGMLQSMVSSRVGQD